VINLAKLATTQVPKAALSVKKDWLTI